MPLKRESGGTSLIDVLDRVLDKGVVIDEFVVVYLGSTTTKARVLILSIEVHLKYPEGGSGTPAFAGTADLLPRALPSKVRRPID